MPLHHFKKGDRVELKPGRVSYFVGGAPEGGVVREVDKSRIKIGNRWYRAGNWELKHPSRCENCPYRTPCGECMAGRDASC